MYEALSQALSGEASTLHDVAALRHVNPYPLAGFRTAV
jgi:hypothetical protein